MKSTAIPIVVGCFGKAFGIYGWIKVISFTSPEENILEFKPWLIQRDGLWEEVYIEDSKKHFNSVVVKLPNINSPEEARYLTKCKIGVWRKQLPKLKADEYYWTDLVSLKVINKEGVNLGVVESLIATGANDVLVVKNGRKRLIPYVSHVILDINLASKVIRVDWEEEF